MSVQSAGTEPPAGVHRADQPVEDPTIGRLVAETSRHLSTLLRSEIALAKAELKVSVVAGGIGAALLAAAGFLLVLVVILVSVALAYALQRWFEIGADWAFLAVAGLYLLIAVVLVLVGIGRLKKVSAPERTIETTKETVATLRRR